MQKLFVLLFLFIAPLGYVNAQEVFRLPDFSKKTKRDSLISSGFDAKKNNIKKIKRLEKSSFSEKISFRDTVNKLKNEERKHFLKTRDSILDVNKTNNSFFLHSSFFCFTTITKYANSKARRKFWDGEDTTKIHRAFAVSGALDGNAGTLFTDWVSDHIGLWRISFATAVTNSKGDTIKSLQNFAAGGGNAILRAHFPLGGWRSKNRPDELFTVLYFAPRIAADIPMISSSKLTTWNMDLGAELQTYLCGDEKRISIGGRFRGALLWGSKDFTELLVKDSRTFFYLQPSLIVGVKELSITINLPITISGSQLNEIPASVTLAYQPKK